MAREQEPLKKYIVVSPVGAGLPANRLLVNAAFAGKPAPTGGPVSLLP
jgi:hypothetical protein